MRSRRKRRGMLLGLADVFISRREGAQPTEAVGDVEVQTRVEPGNLQARVVLLRPLGFDRRSPA
ncbi:hypothetical protein ACFVJS_27340 [Nocardioides sp. NPDC057772]|uniref:hypothetical protein n=1 Tax=Nocardioides sp. NPDC057772 TaxID=3346245 RepID=UPI00366CF7D3